MLLRSRFSLTLAIAAAAATAAFAQYAPDITTPTNDAPNQYKTIPSWVKLPAGRKMGSTSAVDIDKDGKSIWVAERCGANSCLEPLGNPPASGPRKVQNVDMILHVGPDGNIIKMFGAGLLVAPHGIYVDRNGNVWVTDYQDNAPPPPGGRGRGRGTPPVGPIGPAPGATVGHQVWEFSPDGKVLMKLGKEGGAAVPDPFFAPNDVIVAKDGSIFVSEGHGAGNNMVFKFDKSGKLIKSWGKLGTGPGEFDQPHSLQFDSKGLLYIADRNNNRVQVFDQDGNYKTEYHQWSRPSGIFIDKKDNMYSADSESESVSQNHNGWHRGIRVGSLKDGKIVTFIPDPNTKTRLADNYTGTSAAEGVAVDSKGNIYGAEVGPQDVKRYERIKK